jgi:acylphosphatase
MSAVRAQVKISGRVQGVWFRQSTREEAMRLGVNGWCRNCPDGTVEALFEGDKDAVTALLAWCRRGPPLARVTDVTVEWQQPAGAFADFTIRN